MKEQIVGAIVGAIITGLFSVLIFHLGNFSTQKSIVESLSVRFDSINKSMSYEQALQAIYEENEKLKLENEKLTKQNQILTKANEEAANTIQQMHNIDFQNINLIINGIDSGYHDKVIVLDNETFYSQGFLQYIVDNQSLSFNNSKLFIGNVQSEDKMPVSLFELKPFTLGHSLSQTTNEEDNYGNIFSEAFKVRSSNWDNENLMNNATEYYINNNYSTFCFDVAYSKNAAQQTDYEILIYGDGILLKSIPLNRKTQMHNESVPISNIEFLQIVGKCNGLIGYGECYSLIINPYLYP